MSDNTEGFTLANRCLALVRIRVEGVHSEVAEYIAAVSGMTDALIVVAI